ncbi:MAG: COG4315 family predicted lipoprotein [Vulcanimicrobiaceae bacterium]
MNKFSIAAAFLVSGIVLAACGGGGGGASSSMPAGGTSTSAAQPLSTAMLAGSPGYVAPNGHTVYVLSSDSFNNSTCTAGSGCVGLWPLVGSTGGALPTGWWSFTRADSSTQLEYAGWPLYMYSGDSAAGQTNGSGIVSFGGTWSIARPGMALASGTPTPPPGSSY